MRAYSFRASLALILGISILALPSVSQAAEYPFPTVNPRNTYPPATPSKPNPQAVPEPRMEKLLQDPSSIPYNQQRPVLPKRVENLEAQHPLENLLKNTLWATLSGALVGVSVAGLNPDLAENERYQEQNLLKGAQIGATIGAVAGFAIGSLLSLQNVKLHTDPLPLEGPPRNLNPRQNPRWGKTAQPQPVFQLAWNF